MPPKSVMPSIQATAFDCPHCGAYTTQIWYDLYAKSRSNEDRTPVLPTPQFLERIRTDKDIPAKIKEEGLKRFEKQSSGLVCLNAPPADTYATRADNLHLSWCFNCGEFSVWIFDRLVFPASRECPPPNPDLPDDVRLDYEEAGRVLNLSPRGAAALLRLAIQKLCAELGEKGKNIDDDIASLVKKGLSPLVQQSLDAVRVIGNEAVHPGTLDLKDDRDTATRLFDLVNIIAEQMISNPKHVKEIYEKIPEEKRKAIDKRDGKTDKVD
jgi:Domain of unknown function (DUF4145)